MDRSRLFISIRSVEEGGDLTVRLEGPGSDPVASTAKLQEVISAGKELVDLVQSTVRDPGSHAWALQKAGGRLFVAAFHDAQILEVWKDTLGEASCQGPASVELAADWALQWIPWELCFDGRARLGDIASVVRRSGTNPSWRPLKSEKAVKRRLVQTALVVAGTGAPGHHRPRWASRLYVRTRHRFGDVYRIFRDPDSTPRVLWDYVRAPAASSEPVASLAAACFVELALDGLLGLIPTPLHPEAYLADDGSESAHFFERSLRIAGALELAGLSVTVLPLANGPEHAKDELLSRFAGCDVLVVTGHGRVAAESVTWELAENAKVTPDDIRVAFEGHQAPFLVVADCCGSASTPAERPTNSFPAAFLENGCRCFIGHMHSPQLGDAKRLLARVSRELALGRMAAEAVRAARVSIAGHPGADRAWTGFVAFGADQGLDRVRFRGLFLKVVAVSIVAASLGILIARSAGFSLRVDRALALWILGRPVPGGSLFGMAVLVDALCLAASVVVVTLGPTARWIVESCRFRTWGGRSFVRVIGCLAILAATSFLSPKTSTFGTPLLVSFFLVPLLSVSVWPKLDKCGRDLWLVAKAGWAFVFLAGLTAADVTLAAVFPASVNALHTRLSGSTDSSDPPAPAGLAARSSVSVSAPSSSSDLNGAYGWAPARLTVLGMWLEQGMDGGEVRIEPQTPGLPSVPLYGLMGRVGNGPWRAVALVQPSGDLHLDKATLIATSRPLPRNLDDYGLFVPDRPPSVLGAWKPPGIARIGDDGFVHVRCMGGSAAGYDTGYLLGFDPSGRGGSGGIVDAVRILGGAAGNAHEVLGIQIGCEFTAVGVDTIYVPVGDVSDVSDVAMVGRYLSQGGREQCKHLHSAHPEALEAYLYTERTMFCDPRLPPYLPCPILLTPDLRPPRSHELSSDLGGLGELRQLSCSWQRAGGDKVRPVCANSLARCESANELERPCGKYWVVLRPPDRTAPWSVPRRGMFVGTAVPKSAVPEVFSPRYH